VVVFALAHIRAHEYKRRVKHTTPLDVTALVGAVGREVTTTEREGKPARVVVASRIYDTDRADLWNALTTAERIPRWLMPVEGELRLGGRYQLVGNAGGTVTTCDAPEHLALTWEFGGDVSWVDVRLEVVAASRTRLVLAHTAHVDDRWQQFGPGAVGVGWDLALLGLYLHLAYGASTTPEEGQAWAASDEGKHYQRAASTDWCRAAIASGDDPAAAQAAADRTIAAYTGAS
jgi:uncharacterized protein YndB with AHSA1/START domain